ncbi:hypothetical protein L7F22_021791 [Adiantum nelumboides]|nr:hypothetical protein [Adiantum nelumboides]
MVVVKNRYLVMEVLCEGEGPVLTQSSINNAVRDSILHNFGEFGLAASLPSLQVKYVNPATKLCVIRCSRAEYEKIWCAITFITSIGNCPLFFNLLDLSELKSKLGIRAEEMGMASEVGLACPGHSELVTGEAPSAHLEFCGCGRSPYHALQDCDVLLGIPWCYRLHAFVDTFHKKITLVHRGNTHVIYVKLKGKSVPVVSAFAISSVIKNHLTAYLIFAKEVHEVESNLSKFDKDGNIFKRFQ